MSEIIAKGLELVGAHLRAATAVAGHNEAATAAVRQLFGHDLQHAYAAHHQWAEPARENIGLATAPELAAALRDAVQVNLDQAERLKGVFAAAGLATASTPDRAMQGVIDDTRSATFTAAGPLGRDLAIVASGQLAAHVYVARYGTLKSYARILGLTDAADLLQKTLDETNKVDAQLTALAHHLIVRAG